MLKALLRLLAVGLITTTLTTTAGAQSIGLRLLVQPWNPVTDDDTVLFPVDEPSIISDTVVDVWGKVRPELEQRLLQTLQSADLIADGVTLYDVVLDLPQPILSLEPLGGGGIDSPLTVRATLVASGASIAGTTTTPTFLGDWADPRCRAQADISASVELGIGGDLAAPLHASDAAQPVTISINNFSWDSKNFPCDVIKEVVGLVGAERLIANAIQRPENTQPVAALMSAALNQALTTVNQQVSNAIPAGFIRLGAWLRGPSRGSQMLAIYVGVANLPDLSPRGTIRGTLRMADGTSTRRIDCSQLPLYAERTSGPRPVLNSFGTLGDSPPHVELATAISCGPVNSDGSRPYTMTGLSTAFRNYFVQTGLESTGCGETGPLLDASTWPLNSGVSTGLGQPHDLTIRHIEGLCLDQYVIPGTSPGEVDPGKLNFRRIVEGIGHRLVLF